MHKPMTDNPYHLMAKEIDQKGDGLTPWEIKFISSLIDEPQTILSPKQQATILTIYEERIQ